MKKLLRKVFGIPEPVKDEVDIIIDTLLVNVVVTDVFDTTLKGEIKGQTFEVTTNKLGKITSYKKNNNEYKIQ